MDVQRVEIGLARHTQLCATVAIAHRKRKQLPGWQFDDDRERYCCRLMHAGEPAVHVVVEGVLLRFCTVCADRLLGLRQ